jgi:hypothetical protein
MPASALVQQHAARGLQGCTSAALLVSALNAEHNAAQPHGLDCFA